MESATKADRNAVFDPPTYSKKRLSITLVNPNAPAPQTSDLSGSQFMEAHGTFAVTSLEVPVTPDKLSSAGAQALGPDVPRRASVQLEEPPQVTSVPGLKQRLLMSASSKETIPRIDAPRYQGD